MSNAGLGDLVVGNAEDYVNAAMNLASNRQRLGELRGTMRRRMMHSPLMDGNRLARDLEGIYRTAWRRWCGWGE